ncbi:MAG: FtsW/RodA/SpoVE family cell cycle protein, partial [Deltaproteobacteria bacterium]|nr:FtsW/RodA/SpoVE family cell cycle protein [Deltaproteobacteria bacterium]
MSRYSKPGQRSEAGPIDVTLAATLIGLIAFGVVMVYSASAVYANNMFGNGYHFLIRQTVFALLALCVLLVCAHANIDLIRRSTYPVLLVAVLLMIAVALGF